MSRNFQLEGFYRGVIEDNNDPLKIGRCRIRILGVHSPEMVEMPTENLPWAEMASPIFCGMVQGVGMSSVPLNGSWVWVFFDCNEYTKPVYFATTMGGNYEKKPSESTGFRDGDLYTQSNQYNYPRSDRMQQSDFNTLGIDGKSEQSHVHTTINENLISADGITEPSSTSELTEYPYNNIIETNAGHVLEFDDTKGNERIRMFHNSGTYSEFKQNGDNISHTEGDYYILTKNDLKEIVKGEVKRYIQENLTEHIVGNLNLKVDGDLTWNVGGKVTITSGGNYKVTAPRIDLN